MVVLKHNRRQTGLLVVCLLAAVVTGEVLRMMDVAVLTIPVPLVFVSYYRGVGRRLTLQIQQCLYKLKLVVAGFGTTTAL
jgi:hypothetical protein